MNIFVDASNCHNGGGKVLLVDFLSSVKYFPNIIFYVFVDKRLQVFINEKNLVYKKISRYERIGISLTIRSMLHYEDLVLFFGNIPPVIRFKNRVILLQSNRFLIDKYSLSGLNGFTKIRLMIEKMFFNVFKNNVDEFIVQSQTMKSLLENTGVPSCSIKILPLKNLEILKTKSYQKISNSFIYVASSLPYKNHLNLIEAWKLLSLENIKPVLFLTIEKNSTLCVIVDKLKEEFNLNITILDSISRNELLEYYQKVDALIYPSKFESYGLPIVEASRFGLTILAAELDYVRDIIDPDYTFDPDSPISIKRAVKRYLGVEEKKSTIVNGEEFIKKLVNI